MVEDLETGVSEKSKKRQWKLIVIGNNFFITHSKGYAELKEHVIHYYKNQDSKLISLSVPTVRDKYDDIEKDVDNLPYVKNAPDELKLFV